MPEKTAASPQRKQRNGLLDWTPDAWAKEPVRSLWLNQLTISPEMQARNKVRRDVVERYAKAIRQGDDFPPIHVLAHDGKAFIVDGHHRFEAHLAADQGDIKARVREASHSDALATAALANLRHGFPLNSREIAKAKRMALSAYLKGKHHLRGRRGVKSIRDVADDLAAAGIKISPPAVHHMLKRHHPRMWDQCWSKEEAEFRLDVELPGPSRKLREALAARIGSAFAEIKAFPDPEDRSALYGICEAHLRDIAVIADFKMPEPDIDDDNLDF